MHLPKATRAAIALFESIRPTAPNVSVRAMFGQPAAFRAGHLFLGVFGDAVFLRMSETDRQAARRLPGARPFEPMPGRAMREYVVLPTSVLSDPPRARAWIERSLGYVSTLPTKTPARTKSRGDRPAVRDSKRRVRLDV